MGILIRPKYFCIAVFFTVLLLCPIQGWPSENSSRALELFEEKIKAGLVYNFLKYTDWPKSSQEKDTLRVCLFGNDPFKGYLTPLAGRHAQQFVIDIASIDDIQELEKCHLVFIGKNSKNDLPKLLNFLKNKHILTVSDMAQFAQQGGMIELTKEDQRIAFYINKGAVRDAGLNIQDRLLKLAKSVSG
jgi:hypothetical protein